MGVPQAADAGRARRAARPGHLAAVGARQLGHLDDGRRHHVDGQPHTEIRAQLADRQHLSRGRHHVRDQAGRTARAVGADVHIGNHVRVQERGFDLARFHEVPVDLERVVATTVEAQFPRRREGCQITGSIPPQPIVRGEPPLERRGSPQYPAQSPRRRSRVRRTPRRLVDPRPGGAASSSSGSISMRTPSTGRPAASGPSGNESPICTRCRATTPASDEPVQLTKRSRRADAGQSHECPRRSRARRRWSPGEDRESGAPGAARSIARSMVGVVCRVVRRAAPSHDTSSPIGCRRGSNMHNVAWLVPRRQR